MMPHGNKRVRGENYQFSSWPCLLRKDFKLFYAVNRYMAGAASSFF
jgi:hypothetical protein